MREKQQAGRNVRRHISPSMESEHLRAPPLQFNVFLKEFREKMKQEELKKKRRNVDEAGVSECGPYGETVQQMVVAAWQKLFDAEKEHYVTAYKAELAKNMMRNTDASPSRSRGNQSNRDTSVRCLPH